MAATVRSDLRASTNAELMSACLDGAQPAWNTLVDRYAGLVQSVPLRLGLAPAEAEDVTQSTFMALVTSMSTIRQPDRLGSWLVTVAKRETLRVRHHPERGASSDDVDEIEGDFGDEIADAVWLHDAVESLGEPCRTILGHLFFDPTSPTYDELARSTGRAIGSIGPLRGRCLRELRRQMERARTSA